MTHPQTEPGEIVFRITDGRVEITRADPVVVCPGEFLDRVCRWGVASTTTPFVGGPGYDPDSPYIELVSFGDGQHTWTYKITEHDFEKDCYTLRWPD